MRVFISGDRSAHPGMALVVVQQIILQKLVLAKGDLTVLTGDFAGVSEAVRFVCESAGVPVAPVSRNDRGWEDYAREIEASGVDEVVFLHGSPESSNIYKGLDAVFSDEVLTLQSPELVFQPA